MQAFYWEVQGIQVDVKGDHLRKERQQIKNELLIQLPQWATGDSSCEKKLGETSEYTHLRFFPKGEGAGIVTPTYLSGGCSLSGTRCMGTGAKPEDRPLTKM